MNLFQSPIHPVHPWIAVIPLSALSFALLLPLHVTGETTDLLSRFSPGTVALSIDELMQDKEPSASSSSQRKIDDIEFLRRATLDMTGRMPSPSMMNSFENLSQPYKRIDLIDSLLETPEFAQRWAQYWCDVMLYRALDMRANLGASALKSWLTDQFSSNVGWDSIARELITATGDIREDGNTFLILAQSGRAPELAAETSRLFLGIQIQCAQCHDHPYDSWKREQFHELAAFFSRVRIRRTDGMPRSFKVVSGDRIPPRQSRRMISPENMLTQLDTNNDLKLSFEEIPRRFRRLMTRADKDKDDALSLAEMNFLREKQQRMKRNVHRNEYRMPNLSDPQKQGTLMHPVFFVNDSSPGKMQSDLMRRNALADYITSTNSFWFSRAFVNRVWYELMGWSFYDPLDDLGPDRNPHHPAVLDKISEGFVHNGFDLKWLVKTIGQTQSYQSSHTSDSLGNTPYSVWPHRINADALNQMLQQILDKGRSTRRRGKDLSKANRQRKGRPFREKQFREIFGFDPSSPNDEKTGSIQQALYLMNHPNLQSRMRAYGNTVLVNLLQNTNSEQQVIRRLYRIVLARDVTPKEEKRCMHYLSKSDNYREGFEDILWCLINSSEFRFVH